jgi:hypothetical protein
MLDYEGTPEEREVAQRAMLERLTSGLPVTFLDIYAMGNATIGKPLRDQRTFCYRMADRLIQRERKKGTIEKQRCNGKWVWQRRPELA